MSLAGGLSTGLSDGLTAGLGGGGIPSTGTVVFVSAAIAANGLRITSTFTGLVNFPGGTLAVKVNGVTRWTFADATDASPDISNPFFIDFSGGPAITSTDTVTFSFDAGVFTDSATSADVPGRTNAPVSNGSTVPALVGDPSIDATGRIISVPWNQAMDHVASDITPSVDGVPQAGIWYYTDGDGTTTSRYTSVGAAVQAGQTVILNAPSGAWVTTVGAVDSPALVNQAVTNGSTVRPTFLSRTVNGTAWTLIFSEAVDREAPAISATGSTTGAITLTPVSGDGTDTHIYSGTAVVNGETVTFTSASGAWSSVATGALTAAVTGGAVTNSTPPWTPSLLPDILRDGTYGPSWNFTDAGATTPCGIGDGIYTDVDRAAVNNLVQATGGMQPTLQQVSGHYCGRFDGIDDFIEKSLLTIPQPYTLAARCRFAADTSGDNEVIVSTAGAGLLYRSAAGVVQEFGGGVIPGRVVLGGEYITVVALFDGASGYIRINGTQYDGNSGAVAGNAITLGGIPGGGFGLAPVDIFADVVVGGALSAPDLALLETYLDSQSA